MQLASPAFHNPNCLASLSCAPTGYVTFGNTSLSSTTLGCWQAWSALTSRTTQSGTPAVERTWMRFRATSSPVSTTRARDTCVRVWFWGVGLWDADMKLQ